MPLKIQLKKGQKIIINGAVLENAGAHTASILVRNDASILRDSDIITAEEAQTPASRVYYSLQCLYLFPEESEKYLQNFKGLIDSYENAAPSSKPICDAMRQLVDKQGLYQALKFGQELIAHEQQVFSHVNERFGQTVRDDSAGGEPEKV